MLRLLSVRTASLIALLALLSPGCVSSTRHRRALDDLERLRQENLELRRDLVESRVRLQEIAEARGEAPPPRRGAAPEAMPPAGPATAARRETPATPGSVAPGPRSDPPAIEEELILDARPEPRAPAEAGERLLWVARRYGRQGRVAESIDAYTRFIKEYPFSPDLAGAFVERARARLKTGDRRGALEDYQTVVEAFPSSPLAGEARREAARLAGS